MIDSGPGGPILEYLRVEGIQEIDTVILSHADSDHIRGLIAMLDAGFPVKRIVFNSDAAKSSKLWTAFVYSVDDLKRSGKLLEVIEAVEGVRIDTVAPSVKIELLAPRLRLTKIGAGGTDLEHKLIKSNTMSVVAMIRVSEYPLLLFTGDIDSVGCDHLLDSKIDLSADYLVLPHHGGFMGTSSKTILALEALCLAVGPKEVFISNGRGGSHNPQPVVVGTVRQTIPLARIACAQLSTRCGALPGPTDPSSASPYAQGQESGFSCAGTIRLTSSDGIRVHRDTSRHDAFMARHAPGALCHSKAALAPAVDAP
ncbi:ComEC/Rec2 family competence protein [Cryobacterium soli]|uniref:ComEC/Rec2 family competence protein n=1 Tax=Cryobacterium soli TaxID=2220095 RepID=UPI001FE6CE5D|nr:MBL fold metallo-hydrolase [Cryobacterium soli]